MARARGANALAALAYEPSYGTVPASGFRVQPFVSCNLGEEQPLEASDVLGFGRDPQDPTRGAIDSAGDIVVPLCARHIGDWLQLMFGAPTTSAGLFPTGRITFSAQPANNATLTLDGQVITFVTGTPTANQVQIGASLAATVANAVRALNASAVTAVAAATYRGSPTGNAIEITHDTLGTAGNAFTLAVSSSPASNATVSAATLTGGATSGGYRHVFATGALSLPSAALEIGLPDVPDYSMHYGVKANSLAISMARSGNLNATIGLIAQGEAPGTNSTSAGTPAVKEMLKFSHFSGSVLRQGVPIADLVAGAITISNGLDPVPAIRGDGRVSGVDEGMNSVTGQTSIRYSSREFQAQAEAGTPIETEYSWYIPGTPWCLRMTVHRVFLPKAKRPITGPGAIQADYSWQAAESQSLGRTATITLINDVASY